MITETMSWKELLNEISNDFKESHIKERWNTMKRATIRKYLSTALHKKVKVYKPIEMKSKRGNTFYITPIIENSEFDKFNIFTEIYSITFLYQGQMWAAVNGELRKGLYTWVFFSKHFFCRYEERFSMKDESNVKFVQRFAEFFFRNDISEGRRHTNPKTGKPEFFAIMDDGVLLGDYFDNIIVIRTFISLDLLYEDQWEFYRELYVQYKIEKEKNRH